jgi:hypothetical protein
MQKEITDPIEQERIIADFAAQSRQQRADRKRRMTWMQQTFGLLGIAVAALVIDQFSGVSRFVGSASGIHQFRILGILFFAGCLGLLGAKLAAIDEKLDRLLDRGGKAT